MSFIDRITGKRPDAEIVEGLKKRDVETERLLEARNDELDMLLADLDLSPEEYEAVTNMHFNKKRREG